MIENVTKYVFGGFKYELHTDCFSRKPYYVDSSGRLQELPVHGGFMSAEDAIKIHAMNSNGYSP